MPTVSGSTPVLMPSRREVKALKLKLKEHPPRGGRMAGEEMEYDPDVGEILDRGEFLSPSRRVIVSGLESRCHFNTAKLYKAGDSIEAILIGYARHRDSLWYQHTWGLKEKWTDPVIIDTVPSFAELTAYYGLVLSSSESDDFASYILDFDDRYGADPAGWYGSMIRDAAADQFTEGPRWTNRPRIPR